MLRTITRATAALPLDGPLFTGYRITRTVTPVEQQQPGKWTRGDVARVRLLASLTRLLRGSAVASNVFSAWRAVRVTIETERRSAFFGCGDLVAEGTRFDVRVVPGALRVLV